MSQCGMAVKALKLSSMAKVAIIWMKKLSQCGMAVKALKRVSGKTTTTTAGVRVAVRNGRQGIETFFHTRIGQDTEDQSQCGMAVKALKPEITESFRFQSELLDCRSAEWPSRH